MQQPGFEFFNEREFQAVVKNNKTLADLKQIISDDLLLQCQQLKVRPKTKQDILVNFSPGRLINIFHAEIKFGRSESIRLWNKVFGQFKLEFNSYQELTCLIKK